MAIHHPKVAPARPPIRVNRRTGETGGSTVRARQQNVRGQAKSDVSLLDGSQMRTSDMVGKVTLVNFWATTCVSCVKEMPELVATYNKFQARGYDTVAVAMSYDPPAWVQIFAQSRPLPFKVALDNTGEIARAWGDVQLTPTTYLVDKKGQIVKRYVGEPQFDALHQLIEKLLAA